MRFILFSIAVVVLVAGTAYGERRNDVAAPRPDLAIGDTHAGDTQGITDPGPETPNPPRSGCGDVVYQYVPGQKGSIDLETLNDTSAMLDLALEAAGYRGAVGGDSIESDLFTKSTVIAELLEQLCRSGDCTQ